MTSSPTAVLAVLCAVGLSVAAASPSITVEYGCNVSMPPTAMVLPAPGGPNVLYVPTASSLQVFDADTLELKQTYNINAYSMTPLTATKAVSFEALGSILKGGGIGANEIDLTTGALTHRGKLALSNDTTLYSTLRLDDDTVMLMYTTTFMGDPTTISKLTVSTLAISDTVVVGDPDSLGLAAPTYLPDLHSVLFQWRSDSLLLVNVDTMAVKNVTLPAKRSSDEVTMDVAPAVVGSTYAYMSNSSNQMVLVQADMSTSPMKILGETPMFTPVNNQSLYWTAPVAVSGGFLAQYNMWNGTLFSFVPAASSSAGVPKEAMPPVSVPLMGSGDVGATTSADTAYFVFLSTLSNWHPKNCAASFYHVGVRVNSGL